jgi:protein tyrosine/serine phosphatase
METKQKGGRMDQRTLTHGINRSFLLVILCILSAATRYLRSAQADSVSRSSRFPHDCNPAGVTDKDIKNFHQVDADLYRGGRPAYRDKVYLDLAALGVRTIVNLETTEAGEEEAAINHVNQILSQRHSPPITFVHFPISILPQISLTGVPDEGENGIRHLFEELQQAPKPIFVHCEHGKDRTGAVIALYRMRRGEMSFDQAYQEALHYRFDESLDGGLIKTIKRYQDPKTLAALPDPDPSPASPIGVCIAGSPAAP